MVQLLGAGHYRHRGYSTGYPYRSSPRECVRIGSTSPQKTFNTVAYHWGYALYDEDWNEIKHLLKRPEGELPEKPIIRYHEFQYQAKNWDHPQRVVAKVEWHRGQLFPRVGFAMTNLSAKPEGVVDLHNRR